MLCPKCGLQVKKDGDGRACRKPAKKSFIPSLSLSMIAVPI